MLSLPSICTDRRPRNVQRQIVGSTAAADECQADRNALGFGRHALCQNNQFPTERTIMLNCLFLILSQTSHEFMAPLCRWRSQDQAVIRSHHSQLALALAAVKCCSRQLARSLSRPLFFAHMRFDLPGKQPFSTRSPNPLRDENPVLRGSVLSVVRQGWARTKRLAKLHPMAQPSTQVVFDRETRTDWPRLITSRSQARSQFSTFFPFVDKP